MKAIINGKSLNTETATHVCDLECHYYPGDFQYHDTALFVSPKGALFIAGTGGPMSMWAEPCGQSGMTGGRGIRVVDKDEAREYLEAADADEDAYRLAGIDVTEG